MGRETRFQSGLAASTGHKGNIRMAQQKHMGETRQHSKKKQNMDRRTEETEYHNHGFEKQDTYERRWSWSRMFLPSKMKAGFTMES